MGCGKRTNLNDSLQLKLSQPRLHLGTRIVRRNEIAPPQRRKQLNIRMLVLGIEVLSDLPGPEERVLWDDTQSLADEVEPNFGEVEAVDGDGSGGDFDDSEEGLEEGRLLLQKMEWGQSQARPPGEER